MQESYVLFRVSEAVYAVRSSDVEQIEMIGEMTWVPKTPEFIEGIVFLRGQVVPVINMRARFGMERIPYDRASRLVVVKINERVIAFAVDSSREFVHLNTDEIVPPPESLVGPGFEYLEGVYPLENRLILFINLEKLLSGREKQQLSEASERIES
jgi:purine-binding chemotaxis protein CheW